MKVGMPYVEGAEVTAEILEHLQGPKVSRAPPPLPRPPLGGGLLVPSGPSLRPLPRDTLGAAACGNAPRQRPLFQGPAWPAAPRSLRGGAPTVAPVPAAPPSDRPLAPPRPAPQLTVFKYKPKKHYRRKTGHRQPETKFLVTKVRPCRRPHPRGPPPLGGAPPSSALAPPPLLPPSLP